MIPNLIGLALRGRRAGTDQLVWADPGLDAPESFVLTSPAFDDGEPIPDRYEGHIVGLTLSPPLLWTPPPPGTVELALIVEDPDAPRRIPALHALCVGIDPELGGIPENGLLHPSPVPGLRHGKGLLGRRGWAGPIPPRSHGTHHYVFELFALDAHPVVPERFGRDDLVRAMRTHVLARARLVGTFEKR